MSFTTDPNDPRLHRGVDEKPTSQHEVYLILTEEERSKGYVRPVRNTYVHRGRKYPSIRMLTSKEKINDKEYVATADVFSDGKYLGGPYITQEELDQFNETGGYIGGCQTSTTMTEPLAETYARDPSFYGATYCVNCQKHIDVNQFIWIGTNDIVGS